MKKENTELEQLGITSDEAIDIVSCYFKSSGLSYASFCKENKIMPEDFEKALAILKGLDRSFVSTNNQIIKEKIIDFISKLESSPAGLDLFDYYEEVGIDIKDAVLASKEFNPSQVAILKRFLRRYVSDKFVAPKNSITSFSLKYEKKENVITETLKYEIDGELREITADEKEAIIEYLKTKPYYNGIQNQDGEEFIPYSLFLAATRRYTKGMIDISSPAYSGEQR